MFSCYCKFDPVLGMVNQSIICPRPVTSRITVVRTLSFCPSKLLHIISNSWSVMFWRRNDSKRFRKILKLLILFLEVTKLYTICTNNWQTTSHLVNHLKTPQSFTNLQQYLGRTHKSFGFMTSFTTPPINSLPPSKSDRTLRRSCCVSSWNSTFSGLAKAKVCFSKLHM